MRAISSATRCSLTASLPLCATLVVAKRNYLDAYANSWLDCGENNAVKFYYNGCDNKSEDLLLPGISAALVIVLVAALGAPLIGCCAYLVLWSQ